MRFPPDDSEFWRNCPPGSIPSTLTLPPFAFDYVVRADRVLDVGCGAGQTCKAFESVASYVGIDINQKALITASRLQNHRCRFIVGEAQALPFQTGAFQFVLMQGLLTVIVDPRLQRLVVQEARRVLEKGGSLYIADFGRTWSSRRYRRRYHEARKQGLPLGTFPVQTDRSGDVLYHAHHFSFRELCSLLHAGEFRVVRSERVHSRTYHGNLVCGIQLIAQ